eukprot:208295-Chlamydomonas_euryale.AAC.1
MQRLPTFCRHVRGMHVHMLTHTQAHARACGRACTGVRASRKRPPPNHTSSFSSGSSPLLAAGLCPASSHRNKTGSACVRACSSTRLRACVFLKPASFPKSRWQRAPVRQAAARRQPPAVRLPPPARPPVRTGRPRLRPRAPPPRPVPRAPPTAPRARHAARRARRPAPLARTPPQLLWSFAARP